MYIHISLLCQLRRLGALSLIWQGAEQEPRPCFLTLFPNKSNQGPLGQMADSRSGAVNIKEKHGPLEG